MFGMHILNKYNKKYCLKNYQHRKLVERERARLIKLLDDLEVQEIAGVGSTTLSAEIEILKNNISQMAKSEILRYQNISDVPIKEMIRFIICEISVLKIDLKNM